jgi:hypothetical protein
VFVSDDRVMLCGRQQQQQERGEGVKRVGVGRMCELGGLRRSGRIEGEEG